MRAVLILGSAPVAIAGARSLPIGYAWGSGLIADVVSGDFARPPESPSSSLLFTTIVLVALAAAILIIATGLEQSGQRILELPMTRTSVRSALLFLGSALVAVSVLLFARPDESGHTVFFLLLRGYANDSPRSSLALPLVVAAVGVAVLSFAGGMNRFEQESDDRLVTRADVERALAVVGFALVAVAVVLFTLVPDGPNAPLLDTFGVAYTGAGQELRDSSITLAVFGAAVFATGAGIRWHGHSITRTDVECVFLILGSALVALAFVRIALVGDAMGLRVFLPESLEYPNDFPMFLRDSTIVLATLGAGLLIIGAAMRTDRRRG